MLECRCYSCSRTSKDVINGFANMGLGWDPVHRSESIINRPESQLPITNGDANRGGTKQSGQ
jgi:hypothetical protein